MANIKVVVGSTYGNAGQIAEDCTDQLQGMGHEAELLEEATLEQLMDSPDVVLICTSTVGQGEIPGNLLPLYCALKDNQPDLSSVRYGLIALGDSSYETFAEGGKLMNELMRDLNAKPVGQALFIDSNETPDADEEAASWIDQWATKL